MGVQFIVFSCKKNLETARCRSTTIEFVDSWEIEFPLPKVFCSSLAALAAIRFARIHLNLHAHFDFDFGVISSVYT